MDQSRSATGVPKPSVEDVIEWSTEDAFFEGYCKLQNTGHPCPIDLSLYSFDPKMDERHVPRPTPLSFLKADLARKEAMEKHPDVVEAAHIEVDLKLLAAGVTLEAGDDTLPQKLGKLLNAQLPPPPKPAREVMFYLLKIGDGFSSAQPHGHVDWRPVWLPHAETWWEVQSTLSSSARPLREYEDPTLAKYTERRVSREPWVLCPVEIKDGHPRLANMIRINGQTGYKEAITNLGFRGSYTALMFPVCSISQFPIIKILVS